MSADSATKKDDRPSVDQTAAPAVQLPMQRTETQEARYQQAQKDLKKGIKAVSFMSRLMGAKKKENTELVADNESETNESRPEGTDAQPFAQPVDNVGFSPRQAHPPAYIKMRSKHKKAREFDRVFLAQELDCHKRRKVERVNSSNKLRRKSSAQGEANTVWAMEFSKDGRYMAAAGVDGVVRVWAVLSSSDDRQKHEKQESSDSEASGRDAHAQHLSAPVFQSRPIREYDGHTSTVLDLSWSKNNFLLSSSMDKTVRLWHVSRDECLCTFKHSDFVPSIAFHPKDDRFFLAGSLDSKLRLWSIPDKNVAYTAQIPDMITAVTFTPDGKYAVAGCLSGLCMFYETEGLKYQSQVNVRSNRNHNNAKASKITGIHAHHDHRGDIKLLITSNDSRIRLYNLRDKSMELKFRGNENNFSQIRATVSDDGQYVVCGSEDRKAYLWSMGPAEGEKRDKRPVEMFEAHNSITTCVCLAPPKTRHHLSKSEDPIYDLCNPPPVTLMSRAEATGSQSSSRPQSRNQSGPDSVQATPKEFEKPRQSSLMIKDSHRDGNIIVTADYTGRIKVFRQDCAWSKRRQDEWDRSSLFGKRMSRTGSVMTKGSNPSLREGRKSTSLSGPSDRIVSWRQNVTNSPNTSGTDNNTRRSSLKNKDPSSRDISPRRSTDPNSTTSTTTQSKDKEPGPAPRTSLTWDSWAQTVKGTHPVNSDATQHLGSSDHDQPSNRGVVHHEPDNPLMIQGGRSYLFWDTDEWKARSERMHKHPKPPPLSPVPSYTSPGVEDEGGHLAIRPTLNRGETGVSQLSDERSSGGEGEGSGDEEICTKCGGKSFSARKTVTGGTELVCGKCGAKRS